MILRIFLLSLLLLSTSLATPLHAVDDEVAQRFIKEFKAGIDSNLINDRVNAILGLKDADCEQAAKLLIDLLSEDDIVIQATVKEVLVTFRSPDAVSYILEKGVKSKRTGARKWCAIAVGYMDDPPADAIPTLLALLKKERKPDIKAALIRALGRLKAEEAGPLIMKSVNDKDPGIRMEAAYALSRIKPEGTLSALAGLLSDPVWQVRVQAMERMMRYKDPAIVPMLIKRLPKENGRLREDIIAKLTEMTGENFNLDYNSWNAWWAKNQDDFFRNFGKKKARRTNKPTYAQSYFNISTYSKSFIFILDLSKSMDWGIVPAKSYGYGLKEVPRIDLAKKEMKRLIEEMEGDTSFNIVHFAGAADCWTEGLSSATSKNKKDALEYVDKINTYQGDTVEVKLAQLLLSTNLYEALDMVLKWQEESMSKKNFGAVADTIYLLTDGTPAGTDWLTNQDAIEYVLKERNRHLKIRIHSVSLADDLKSPAFLRKISEGNGGEFKDVLQD